MAEKNREQAGGEKPRERRKLPEPRPDPPNWYAVYAFESSYSKPATPEDLEMHSRATKKVLSSSLPEPKRKKALEYLKMGEGAPCGRFSVTQTEAVADKYADGQITDDQLDFEIKLMHAWCGNTLPALADQESVTMDTRDVLPEERKLAKRMLAEAKEKSDIIMAIAISAMRVYYSGADEKARVDMLSKAMELVESARDRL